MADSGRPPCLPGGIGGAAAPAFFPRPGLSFPSVDEAAARPTHAFRIETAGKASRAAAAAGCGILIILALLPVFAGRNLIQDLIFLFYMLALAQCWNLLAGYAGLISV